MRCGLWLMLMMVFSTSFDVCDNRSGMTSTRMTIKREFGLGSVFGSLGLGSKIHISILNF
jgi:hypothetical protein